MKSEMPEKRSWFERLSDLLIREPKDRTQLMEVLRDAEDRDILSEEMLGMIESVVQVSEMQVREVMVPKSQMVTIDKNSTLQNILPIVIESAHSRFPVTDNEDVVGILLAKDLLKYGFHPEKSNFVISENLRPAVFIPQGKRLDVLLREFRLKRNHIAIVIDEYGQVSGLITIEDVLEQIVGDIEDEYDIDEDDDIKKHEEGNYTVKASTTLSDFNAYFKTNFKGENASTIGELLSNSFDYLPKRGETIVIKGYHFKILHSDNRRILLLEVRKEQP
ncbi:MAG TPA: transporter associated domain-containing protein [Gammaproteobacteria bacterium]|nr:transporter associated domain-containing protein [Gammaproteobacteria bacterium]